MTNVPRSEIETCTQIVHQMRMNELQAVLHAFDAQKGGLKKDLIQRIINMMNTTRIGSSVCAKIREFSRSQPQRGGTTVGNYNQNFMQRPMFPIIAPRNAPNNGYPYGVMQHNQPVNLPSRIGGRAEKMQITRLPFFDVHKNVLKISELSSVQSRTVDARISFTFSVPPEWLPMITHPPDTPLPRYELQLRMFALDLDMEQPDDFPPNCIVKIGQGIVPLPPIIPTNKPNAEQKRYSRPVDITPYCQPDRRTAGTYKVEIDWTADKRVWAVGVWVVYRLNSQILHDRMMADKAKRRSIDETKKMIKSMLDGDDDNVALDQIKISLLDPLMKIRMKIPIRTKYCNHLQCFDLMNYLMMNEKRPTWKCPNCPANAHYDNLVVDEYFMDLLKNVDSNVTEVELLRDGNWKVLVVDDDESSDDEYTKPKKETEQAKKGNESDDCIIILSSDDEGPPKTQQKKEKSSSCEPSSKQRRTNSSVDSTSSEADDDSSNSSTRKRKIPGRRDNQRATSSNDEPEIITLSDDDDEGPPVHPVHNLSNNNGTPRSTASPASVSAPNSNSSGVENLLPTKTTNGEMGEIIDTEVQNRYISELESEIARGLGSFVHSIVARSINGNSSEKQSMFPPFNAS